MRRIVLDMASQVMPLASNLIDRVILTAVMVRIWGVTGFEYWSILMAAVTIFSIIDMGSQISFSNKMAEAAHAGAKDQAARIYAESNMIFLGLAATVMGLTLLVALLPPVQQLMGLPAPLGTRDQIALLALGFAVAGRMAMSNQAGVYRANSAFARGTTLIAGIDLLRVLLTLGTLAFGFDLMAAALATAASVVIGNMLMMSLDIARRFPLFRYRVARPTPFSTKGQLRLGLLYSVGFIPSVVMVQLPVLLIGSSASATNGVLASYVLLRTLSNFLRTSISKFTFVLAMELARLKTQKRDDLFNSTYRLVTRAVACLFGLMAGMLLGFGPDLMQLWVGNAELFDPVILLLMLSPLVVTPTVQIASPYLIFASRPGPVAKAVLLQSAAAALLAVALPIDNIAIRLTVAVYCTELFPLALVILRAVHARWSLQTLWDEASATALAIGLLVASYGASVVIRPLFTGQIMTLAGGAMIGAAFGLALLAGFYRPFTRWKANR